MLNCMASASTLLYSNVSYVVLLEAEAIQK